MYHVLVYAWSVTLGVSRHCDWETQKVYLYHYTEHVCLSREITPFRSLVEVPTLGHVTCTPKYVVIRLPVSITGVRNMSLHPKPLVIGYPKPIPRAREDI
jgi:hypothetical protein